MTGVARWTVALAAASVVCWLLSFSWVLGGAIPVGVPAGWRVSPWVVAELAAIPLGVAAAVCGAVELGNSASPGRRWITLAAWAGGFAALLATIGVASS
ncbi:hypothetical protein [Georgenia sp. SYP-B2076]|uniref:hypothetical protein n=1 Tax=Georgenia sp. SYP-B2076 TaxID=2495881 RepID=UPI000F8C9DC5|nr:hypothetical protein [Georgenia sp. SYP-B2076]